MASMQELKRRMESITVTHKITKAMKMLSTVKLNRFKTTLYKTKDFYQEFYEVIGAIITNYNKMRANKNQSGQTTKSDKKLWIVISTQLGLCGSYNTNIGKLLANEIGKNDQVILIGNKLNSYLKTRNLDNRIIQSFSVNDKQIDFDWSYILGKQILELNEKNKYESINCIYTTYINNLNFQAKKIQLMPADPSIFDAKTLDSINDKFPKNISFEPSVDVIIPALEEQLLQVILYGCLIESKVCEYASRRNAMDTAAKNADDLYNKYKLLYNQLRQAKITQEINEIVAGAAK
ncbi:ATP synthase F1 subunit gamma [Mycoplasma sp. T363T]|uniref:ATP synthase gamma chain n=1 Tax=Mycoplasma bradburyae TaxID=2963128 RepID=A0ABT5GAV3_9MOLU|nr:ATP synthase F1 subunit gamma [Mycoplasma bradburyae]MDC4163344.1 ATP synthase F1 subunit gamma [Mycoplasma bradburyae]MDC4181958.1 ATP synthase F1 subunit gamma [Mycoplasma bradburyae]MDC4182661.1 ATP synthase F1 subunit gamma [Mycoplasma bradburyae]UTS70383.1 ATP synthase F1 subunit gamma [Mycoplasma bradburyae]